MTSQYRHDPISDRWVIIAPERAKRPDQLGARPATRRVVAPCPFCRGQEDETPAATAVYPPRGDWQVRVVPNLFPAVQPSPSAAASSDARAAEGVGAHEVIIESPRHVVSLSNVTDQQLAWTFQAYQDRLAYLSQNTQLEYGLVFKNARAEGGASLEHTHSQLIATTQVPRELAVELGQATVFWGSQGSCIFCEALARERNEGARVIAEHQGMVAFCPFASRFPYEIWVLPADHEASFLSTSAATLRATGELVREMIRRLEASLPEPAYNFWIHTQPFRVDHRESFHWHIEIVPRLTRLAGFELGAGYFINPVAPEEAARLLRSS